MILNEEKFLEDFTYDISKECERDFTLVVRQSKSPNITFNSNAANGEAVVIGYADDYIAFSQQETNSINEDIYYKLPNDYKYQLKFIVPRADKDLDNNGLILPINSDSKNYFNTFLMGKLTQENGFVSYNKIYNKINTKIPDKYKCNGNYIIGCKFLSFVIIEPSIQPFRDYIFVFDIEKSISENKKDMVSAATQFFPNSGFKEPSSSALHFIMFDFNIEGYSEDDGIVAPEDSDKESIKDLLYHKYGNVFPREPYKIMHKKQLGNDIEIFVYKKKDDVDYSDILNRIPGIRYRIGSGHDKFVMVWKNPNISLHDSEEHNSAEHNSDITGESVTEALEKEGHKVIYDSNDNTYDIAVYNHDFDGKGGYASLEIFITKKQGIITIYSDSGSKVSLRNLANLWDLKKNSEGIAYRATADLNRISVLDIVKMVNDYFRGCKNS